MRKYGYKNLWMSPSVAIVRLNYLIEKYGIQKILSKSIFKHEREAWIAAVFLLGLRQQDSKEYWLEIETEQATPDIYGYQLREVEGNYRRDVYNIEITEWEEHGGNIIDIIKNKSKKSYSDYFFLLIYARKGGEIIDYSNIYNEILSFRIPFSEIWILASSSYNQDYHLTRVYKQIFQIRFNLNSAIINNKEQKSFATFLKRGKGTEFKNLGQILVPYPQIDE